MLKIAGSGSGSINHRHGSADPDPHLNVMDPEHAFLKSGNLLVSTVPYVPILPSVRVPLTLGANMTIFCNEFYFVSFLIRVVLWIRINFSQTDFKFDPDRRFLIRSSKLPVKTLDYLCNKLFAECCHICKENTIFTIVWVKQSVIYGVDQSCGSGSAWIRINLALLDPDMDLYWEYGSGFGSRTKLSNKHDF